MANERVIVRAKEVSDEDLYFQDQDKKKMEELRSKAAKDSDKAYRDAHRNHCFRCGTPSLAEVEHKRVKIDLCVNEGCGAVHLDPGEMEKILEGGRGLFDRVKRSFVSALK
jgi:hypothetical protein